jgi:hypothetical protein
MLLDQGDDAKKGDEKEHVTLAAWRRGDGQDLSSGAISGFRMKTPPIAT